MSADLSRVRAFIERLAPAPVCDACIAERLGLDTESLAERKTHELAGGDGFERGRALCALCGLTRSVTRRR
ncbi:MAG: hypothetical protein EOP60_00565 [Sphingomonadales bacterium]|nr:MAG: hypothetical protein EOP60_00565 [Sphingomonadales bacterium]